VDKPFEVIEKHGALSVGEMRQHFGSSFSSLNESFKEMAAVAQGAILFRDRSGERLETERSEWPL
jgi:hypothetical protein